MGYSLYIRRKDKPITVEEWCDYINSDSSFTKTDVLKQENPFTGQCFEIPSPDCGLWKSEDAKEVPFMYKNGEICVSSSEGDVGKKMVEVSKALNAKLVGEEGEEYGMSDFLLVE